MIDLRGKLPTQSGGAGWSVGLEGKTGVVIHYNGGPVPRDVPDIEWAQRVARWHIDRNWNSAPGGPFIAADGIQYHRMIGRAGDIYRLRDEGDVLWHCGSWPENETHLAVYVRIGGNQHASQVQLGALNSLIQDLIRTGRVTREQVIGHQEVDWTACPGTLMDDFVLPFRKEITVAETSMFFHETGHSIGGAFREYWRNNGGLMIFGYPLTDEFEEDGMTVQYFERAVFEWHPENDPPYRVLLRRLGAHALHDSGFRV
jgi:hypothetical protein